MKYRALDIVVKDLCEVIGDYEHKKYVQVMKECVRMLERFNVFHESPYYRSTTLVVSSIYTAEIPEDCVKPIKVGVCINNHIHSFYYNAELCSPKDIKDCCCTCENTDVTETTAVDNDGNEIIVETGTCAFCSFPNYYCNNNSAVPYTNYGSTPYQTYVGWFNYELDKNRIVFDPQSSIQPNDEVVLMYKSSIQKSNGTSIVPLELWEMLRYGILARFGDVRYIQYYTSKSEAEERAVVRLYNRLTKEEMEHALFGYKHLSLVR